MEDKKLKHIYDKHINIPFYRVIPIRDYDSIKKQGINPVKDPYEKIKPKIKLLAKIIEKIEKKGFILYVIWGGPVQLGYAMKVSLHDLKIPLVDFAPTIEDVKYYLNLKGGALVSNIKKITDVLIKADLPITNDEKKLIIQLNKWSKKLTCKNIVLSISGSCQCFEKAKFQLSKRGRGRKKEYKKPIYLTSPFGSFEHFKKVIKKYDYRKYSYSLRTKKFYLRVGDKISAKEIKRIK